MFYCTLLDASICVKWPIFFQLLVCSNALMPQDVEHLLVFIRRKEDLWLFINHLEERVFTPLHVRSSVITRCTRRVGIQFQESEAQKQVNV